MALTAQENKAAKNWELRDNGKLKAVGTKEEILAMPGVAVIGSALPSLSQTGTQSQTLPQTQPTGLVGFSEAINNVTRMAKEANMGNLKSQFGTGVAARSFYDVLDAFNNQGNTVASKLIDTYQKQKEEHSKMLPSVAKGIAASIISDKTLGPDYISHVANEYGYDVNAFTGAVKEAELDLRRAKLLNDVSSASVVQKTTPKNTTTPQPTGPVDTDLDALISRVPNLIQSQNGKVAFANSIKQARNDADKIAAVATVVLRNSPAEVRRDFTNQTTAIKQLDKAIALIDNGTKTGVINNARQYAYNVAGKDFDPKLAAINSYITAAIQPYRNSVTGAAWGDQEDAEYATLFGSTKYSPAELKSRLLRVKEIMRDKSAAALNAQVNPTSDYNPFQANETVTVISPKGVRGKIPVAQLPAALKAGYKQQ